MLENCLIHTDEQTKSFSHLLTNIANSRGTLATEKLTEMSLILKLSTLLIYQASVAVLVQIAVIDMIFI